MSDTAWFELNLINNTNGAITYNGFTNGVGSPPTSSGNPPVLIPLVPAMTTVIGVIVASGGGYWRQYMGGTTWSTPNTTGKATFNLPDASVLTVNWDVPYNGSPKFNTPTISSPTSYEVIQSSDGGTLILTIQQQD